MEKLWIGSRPGVVHPTGQRPEAENMERQGRDVRADDYDILYESIPDIQSQMLDDDTGEI
jgi:hypothetical protein